MKWYKFWKKSGPTQAYTEDFIELDEKIYPTEKDVLSRCERWAAHVGGGFNTYYNYGFEEIKTPPKYWLEKQIEFYEDDIEEMKKLINYYKQIIKTNYNNRTKLKQNGKKFVKQHE